MFSSQKKRIEHKKSITDINDFKKNVIKRKIQEFYDSGVYGTQNGKK